MDDLMYDPMDDSTDSSMDISTDDSENEEDDQVNEDYDYLKLWPAVQEEFQLGSTMEEAFRSIYRKRGQNPPSFSMIHDWLKDSYEEDFDPYGRTSSFDDDLRSAIIGQYLKFTKTIYFSDNWKFNPCEAVLNSRFMFITSTNRSEMFPIIDLFTGERRNLQGPSDEFKETSPYSPIWIDHERILIMCSDSVRTICFRLLKFDIDELKWFILDSNFSNLEDGKMIADSSDRSKFALVDEQPESILIQRGKVIGDKILMDEQRIEIHAELYYPKLEGDKMYAFQLLHNEENNDEDWHFCEYAFDSGSARMINSVISQFRLTEIHYNYTWSKSKLYVCDYAFNLQNWFAVVSFDPDTLSWSQTNLAGSADPSILSVDEDEVLTVSAIDGNYLNKIPPIYKSIYRFPMRKPENLRYLAWSTIRRGSLFFGSDLYERLAPRLPYNSEFRSFLESG